MSSTKLTQIENIQFQFTKHCDVKYINAQQVLNITYSNPLEYIQDLFLYDTRTAISHGYPSMVKGKIITMVISLSTGPNNILRITNLLNKCPI